MIVILHALYFLRFSLFRILTNFYKSHMSSEGEDGQTPALTSEVNLQPRAKFCENGVTFSPPAYVQRYGDVCDILKNDTRWAGHVNKVVDFGCAELSFFTYLKNIPEINTVLEVDYDGDLLSRFHSRVEPLFCDHILPRKEPLKVSILQGSVSDPDYRLVGCDAVICIELIEHLDPAAFDRLPHNVFGFIRPRLIIITTPNADFNVLFPNLKDGGFRHYDHRFEWTRDEFIDWSMNVISRYPDYTVEMIGVAPGPEGTESLGCCSQMALFINHKYEKAQDIDDKFVTKKMTAGYKAETEIKNCDNLVDPLATIPESAECQNGGGVSISSSSDDDTILSNDDTGAVLKTRDSSFYHSNDDQVVLNTKEDFQWDCRVWENGEVQECYTGIAEYVYPHECDNRSRENKILDEVLYKVGMYTNYNDDFYDEEGDFWLIPISQLLTFTSNLNVEADELRTVLINAKYEIQDDKFVYRKPVQSSSNTSYTEEEFLSPEMENQEQVWEEAADEDPWARETKVTDYVWGSNRDDTEPHTVEEVLEPDVSDNSADELEAAGLVVEGTPVTLYTGLLGDSLASASDDRSRSDSPLAQLFGASRGSEDQRLSDSGYLKSQDSPQSPVCSDSFSNDLITPDKDVSDMMIQSTILECIPENLNCPTSCSSPKEGQKLPESRRRSVGPIIGSESSRNSEFPSGPSMSRPKSLHTCTTNFEFGQNEFKATVNEVEKHGSVSTENSPQAESPQLNFLSPEEVVFHRNEPLHFENVPRNFNAQQRLANNQEPRRDDFEVHERLARPDFLNIHNLEVAVVDHLNNNVDFEGNNFDDRERGDIDVERVHVFEAEFVDDAENVLRNLDRHNENHIIDDHNIEEEIIVEQVFQYQENFEGDENYGFNPGNVLADVEYFQDNFSFPNTPDLSHCDDNSIETNFLLDSIAQTLSLNPDVNIYTEDDFPTRSPCAIDETFSVPSTSKCSKSIDVGSDKDGFFWESKYLKSEKNITRMLYFPSMKFRGSDNSLDELTCCDDLHKITNVLDIRKYDTDCRSLKLKDTSSSESLNVPDMSTSLPIYTNGPSNNLDKDGIANDADISEARISQTSFHSTVSHQSSTIIDYFLVEDSAFPDWLLYLLNVADNYSLGEAMNDFPRERGGAGDGVGVHSLYNSGHESTSNSSSGNSATIDPSELPTISSENMPLYRAGFLSPRDYRRSSAASSVLDYDGSIGMRLSSAPPDSDQTSSTGDGNIVNSVFSLHVQLSNTSSNDADIEVDSDSDN